jgi:hypothetical protein
LSCRACPINLKPGPAVRRLPTVHPGSACRAGPRLLCCRACSPTGPAVAGVPGGLVRALKAGPSRFYSAGQAVVLGLLSCPGLPGPAVVQGLLSESYRAGCGTGSVVIPGRACCSAACSEAIKSQVALAHTAAALTSRDVRLAYPGPAYPPSKATEVCAKSRLLRKSTLACSATTPCPCTGPVIPMITLTFI